MKLLAVVAALAVALVACAETTPETSEVAAPVTTIGTTTTTEPACISQLPDGVSELVFESDEGPRAYRLAVPAGPTKGLIFDFHGTGGSIDVHDSITVLSEKGPARGYVVVTPQGEMLPERWTVPGIPGPDDVAFVEALDADLRAHGCIDGPSIATGMSSGAAMTSQLACESDVFSIFAPVGGVSLYRRCPEGAPISMIAYHGTEDVWVSYEGPPDWEEVEAEADTFYIGDVQATIAAFVDRGECGEPIPSTLGEDVIVERHECDGGNVVSLYTMVGAGHSHPGEHARSVYEELGNTLAVGPINTTFDGTDEMLDFFDEVIERRQS